MALVTLAVAAIASLSLAIVPSCTLDPMGLKDPNALGTGGAGQACTEPIDCPGLFTECEHPICASGICGTHYENAGKECSENEGVVCDGGGECVECVDVTQCDGGDLCQANQCVPAYCGDGVQNGDETDLDCGGSCGPCANGKFCGEGGDCESGYCASNGVCAPCSVHEDCAADHYCCLEGLEDCDPNVPENQEDVNTCLRKKEPGEGCYQGVECELGFCPEDDHVCCDSECDGHCYACLDGKNDDQHGQGECGPVTTHTDPDAECGQLDPSTCGSDGRGCDGAGACLLWPNDTVCDDQHCSGGDTQHYDDTCDGSGSCDDNGIDGCSPYICEGTTCRTSCTGDGHCLTGSWCDAPNCVSDGNQGDPCGGDNQCASDHCVDGYCCESACTGECMACAASKTDGPNGDCQAITHNTDPDNDECPNGACYKIDANNGECRLYVSRPCGSNSDCMNNICRDGYCCENGCSGTCMACRGDWTVGNNGQCRAINTGTDPRPECNNGACYNNSGTGECRLDQGQICLTGSACLNGICVDGRCCENLCNGTCVACRGAWTVGSDGQCRAVTNNTDPNSECSDGACWGTSTTAGECRSDQGEWCNANDDCLNNRCRDNYCCNSDCGAICESCNSAQSQGANGICSDVDDGTDPDDNCANQGGCGLNGACDNGLCDYYGTSVSCDPEDCTGSTYTPERFCDGDGACDPASPSSCSPYVCDGDVCSGTCDVDGECASTHYCTGTGGNCLPKVAQGQGCTDDHHCINDNCVDDFCCNSACDGLCESCDGNITVGADGVCSDLSPDTDPESECETPPSDCCNAGACVSGSC